MCMGSWELASGRIVLAAKRLHVSAYSPQRFTDGAERAFLSTPTTDTFQLFSSNHSCSPPLDSQNISLRCIFFLLKKEKNKKKKMILF